MSVNRRYFSIIPPIWALFTIASCYLPGSPLLDLARAQSITYKELAHGLIEPHLTIKKGIKSAPTVALTFDLCMGATDYRILNNLINNNIKATLFVTARWLSHNPKAVALIKEHPDLFEINNHGKDHLAAIDNLPMIYGIRTAGSLPNIRREVEGGEEAIIAYGFPKPLWFRGAAARYSRDGLELIKKMGYKIAGFSINGDAGASLSTAKSFAQLRHVHNGDVIIAHMNHPERPSGAGIVKGILLLKHSGYRFVTLSEDYE